MAQSSSVKSLNPAKLIRDTFSMPDSDYRLIAKLMKRSPAQSARTTKSELVRAGIRVLNAMDDDDLEKVLTQVERLKTGRPAKDNDK
ncbi:hypothetical protein [Kaarinaea lacus]